MTRFKDWKLTRRTAIKAAAATAATRTINRSFADHTEPLSTVVPMVSDKSPPSPADWQAFADNLTGELLEVKSPLEICKSDPKSTAAQKIMEDMKNPFFLYLNNCN